MRIRKSTVPVLSPVFITAIVIISALQPVGAQQLFIGADGCAVLADMVQTEVHAAAFDGAYDFRLPVPPENGQVVVCNQTAQAVTMGFSSAMAGMNIFVTWSTPEQQRGDACLSHDLTQCYPERNPFVPYSVTDARVVANAWWSVVTTLARSMPMGTRSDSSQFVRGELERRIAAHLSLTSRKALRPYAEIR